MISANPYAMGLDKNPANHVSLSPLSFLTRAARVYPDRVAIIHGSLRQTWAQTEARCRRLASALRQRGIGKGDTVAVMLPNVPAMLEAHFGVPMTGAVLNTLNTRLDAEALAFQLEHGNARVLLTDPEYARVIRTTLDMLGHHDVLVVDVEDEQGPHGERLGALTYEALLAEGDPKHVWSLPDDEWDAISLNYTSGTTGNPKGWSPTTAVPT